MSNATLTQSDMTERLDHRDLLDTSRRPGVYALGLAVPSMPTVAREQWDAVHDARPDDDALDRLAAAQSPLYVGAATEVYTRLCDHADGVRVPAVCEAFPPTAVRGVWSHSSPFDGPELNRALALARDDDHVVWVNGEVFG